MASNNGLLSKHGLRWGNVAYNFGLLGFPGRDYFGILKDFLYRASSGPVAGALTMAHVRKGRFRPRTMLSSSDQGPLGLTDPEDSPAGFLVWNYEV